MILEWKPLETDKFIITEYSLSCKYTKMLLSHLACIEMNSIYDILKLIKNQ